MKTLKIMFLWTMALGFCGLAAAAEFDTLYIRDGQILKGTIIQDNTRNYLVYSAFGELTVGPGDVIYATKRDAVPPIVEDTHILIGGTTETISIVEQEVPERRKGASSFNLLVPGVAQSVLSADGDAIPFKSRLAGENSLVTIQYADIPAKTARIRVAMWRIDLLTPAGEGCVKFLQKYAPDREGAASVIVKYPKEWKVRSVTPPPARQFDGLITWHQTLRRQEEFTPEIVFRIEKI